MEKIRSTSKSEVMKKAGKMKSFDESRPLLEKQYENAPAMPGIEFHAEKCVGCGASVEICSSHELTASGHKFNRRNCIGCGKCAEVCLPDAFNQSQNNVRQAVTLRYLNRN